MPTYSIEGPDKKTYSIEGPEGASREQIIAKIKERQDYTPSKWSDHIPEAISDVPAEIGRTAGSAIDTIKEGLFSRKGEQGVIEGTLKTGRGLLAIPELAASPITGAAKSLLGHPMAQATHAIGSVIAPEIAAKDDPKEMYQKAAQDVDTALGATMAGKGKIPKLIGDKLTASKQLAPTEKQLKAAYKTDYDISEKSGIVFKPEAVKKFKDFVVSGEESSFHDEILSPKAFKVMDKLYSEDGGKVNSRTTVPEIDNVRKLLGRLAGGPDKYEKEAATHFIQKIDTFMKDVPNLVQARANYAARERALLIEKAVKNAERRAQGSGTGANINNALRQEVRKIREKKSRGFTESELAEMDKIIAGTWTGDILRWLGKMAPTGIIPTAGGLGVGSLMGSPLGAAGAMGVGTLAKIASDKMTRNAIKKLSETTRLRSPLAAKETEVRDFLKQHGLQ